MVNTKIGQLKHEHALLVGMLDLLIEHKATIENTIDTLASSIEQYRLQIAAESLELNRALEIQPHVIELEEIG